MQEIWKDVEGYEGCYMVSNLGRIKSLERVDNMGKTRRERILKPKVEKNGYARVYLCKNGTINCQSVHRIVAKAFVERKNEGDDIVNHLDNNPSNNRADNLEWTTYKGNMQWAAKQGRMPCNQQARINIAKNQKARRVSVIAISPNGERIRFRSQTEAARHLGVQASHISAACRKEYGYKKLNGYEFEYADTERQKNAKPKRVAMPKEQRIAKLREMMKGNTYAKGSKCSENAKIATRALHSKPIIQKDKQGNVVAEFPSCAEALAKTGISHTFDVANGKRKSAGGYLWEWKEKK